MFDYTLGRCLQANGESSPLLSSSVLVTTMGIYIAFSSVAHVGDGHLVSVLDARARVMES